MHLVCKEYLGLLLKPLDYRLLLRVIRYEVAGDNLKPCSGKLSTCGDLAFW